MLAEEFLVPLGQSQVELANRIGVSFHRTKQIVNRKRAITPDTALRLSRLLGTSPDLWLNPQQRCELYDALDSPEARNIGRIKPLRRKAS